MTPGMHPLVSPPAPQSSICFVVPKADKNKHSSETALELGTLHPTLDQSFAFSPWPLTSFLIRHEPTTTIRSMVDDS